MSVNTFAGKDIQMQQHLYRLRLLTKSNEILIGTGISFKRDLTWTYLNIILVLATIAINGCHTIRHAEPPPPEAPPLSATMEIIDEFEIANSRLWDSGHMSTLEWQETAINIDGLMPLAESNPDIDEQLLVEVIGCTDTINTAAKKHGVDSIVMIKTDPKRGATIRYQTYGSRYRGEEPITAKGLSPCKERMPIGWYYFWSERNGKPTSNQSYRLRILDSEEEVEIEEASHE